MGSRNGCNTQMMKCFKACPMYHAMANATTYLSNDDIVQCQEALFSANQTLKTVLHYFYSNLNHENVNRDLWMAYVQGFHGWSAGEPLQDGVSGGQSLVIRAIDSFLGIRPWPTEEAEALHLPFHQRQWLNAMREYDIRTVAKMKGSTEIENELNKMVAQLRVSSAQVQS